jgi:hypothetical protein
MAASFVNYQSRKPSNLDYGAVAALRLARGALIGTDDTVIDAYVKSADVNTSLGKLYKKMAGEHLLFLLGPKQTYNYNWTRYNLTELPKVDTYAINEAEIPSFDNQGMPATDAFKTHVSRIGTVNGINPSLILSGWVTLVTQKINNCAIGAAANSGTTSLKEIVPYLPSIMGSSSIPITPNLYIGNMSAVPGYNAKGGKRSKKRRRRNSYRY